MAHIVDIDGKTWSLASRTDSMGRVYARAYRNAWDPVKRRSFVEARIQIGRVQSDGSITLSENFKKKFPAFAEGEWCWGEKELLPRECREALGLPPDKEEDISDISWSAESIRYGLTWIGWEMLRREAILQDLAAVFGDKDADLIAALALFKLEGHDALSAFEDWVPQVWLPGVAPASSEQIAELMDRLDDAKFNTYYARRSHRALDRAQNRVHQRSHQETPEEAAVWVFDCTGSAAYGASRWRALKSTARKHFLLACDRATGDVLYADVFDDAGSREDRLNLFDARMKHAGLAPLEAVAVADGIDDPKQSEQLEGQRRIIESGFERLAQDAADAEGAAAGRLLTTGTVWRGKLFVFSIAEALRLSMLKKLQMAGVGEQDLPVSDVSLQKLFMQLCGLQAHLHRSTSVYVAAVPGEKFRRLAQLLGIGKLPQRLEL